MLRLFVGPTMVYLFYFFCSSIQLYLLLSPYLCFISFLYLDFNVVGDDPFQGGTSFFGSFMGFFCLVFAMPL